MGRDHRVTRAIRNPIPSSHVCLVRYVSNRDCWFRWRLPVDISLSEPLCSLRGSRLGQGRKGFGFCTPVTALHSERATPYASTRLGGQDGKLPATQALPFKNPGKHFTRASYVDISRSTGWYRGPSAPSSSTQKSATKPRHGPPIRIRLRYLGCSVSP